MLATHACELSSKCALAKHGVISKLCRSSMIYFINFIFSQHKLKIAKLSYPFSHQFDTVLFYNFRKFEILSATNNFSHLDENVIPREDNV